ncbi:MAG TPA: hypothetical protein VLT33_00695 [Labilithrix sp.]|nr:hypothetical protein [Labilithrix sp.]
METSEQAGDRARAIAREVLVEAFGASATPFVPVPFVDDWMLARLLRRIAGKVLARHGLTSPPELPKVIVDAYVEEGSSSLARSVVVGAARFVVRKLAIVLDVKKSYDVFGQSVVFALALDLAASRGWLHEASAERVGAAVHRTLKVVGSGAIESLGRAGRAAYAKGGAGQLADAIAGEVDRTRAQLEPVLRQELRMPANPA